MMLLRRRLPLRLLRPLQAEVAVSTTSSSSTPPPLQKPIAAAAILPSVALGSRIGFLNATPHALARGASASAAAAFIAPGAAAALASLPVAYADANDEGAADTAASVMRRREDLALKERKRRMELVQSRGMPRGSYPQFDVAVKGQKVIVKFNTPSTCNVSHLIVDLVTHIGLEAGYGSEMLLRAWDRILSVILRQIDGFEQDRRVVVIAATNRKEDLDPALISRFDSIICFGLPDQQTRVEIASQYAQHLTKSELAQFSLSTEEMSGRDIRDVCMQAERHWASKGTISKRREGGSPVSPPIDEYVACAEQRRNSLPDRTRRTSRSSALKLA